VNRFVTLALRAVAYVVVLQYRYAEWLINSPSEVNPATNRSPKAERTMYPLVLALAVFLFSVQWPHIFGWRAVVLSGLALIVTGYFAVVVIRDVYAQPKE